MGQQTSTETSDHKNDNEVTIYQDDKYTIKKPEKLNYRIYDGNQNRCATFELKEDSLYINTMKYLSCELVCEIEMRLLHNFCKKYAKISNKNKLILFDSSFMYIYYGLPKRVEYYNLKYIYLFTDPTKPSYYINTLDYLYEFHDSPVYKYMIKEFVRIVTDYKKNTEYELLFNCKNLQFYSRYCYLYDQNKNKSDINLKYQDKYDDYLKKIEAISVNFKKNYKLFKEYIDYYTGYILKKYILDSTEVYKDDIYFKKLSTRAIKYDFRLSSIFNDDYFLMI